jgi:hypothetical protein
VAEWLNAHAWKACLRKRNGGSNPPLSAEGDNRKSDIGYPLFIFPETLINTSEQTQDRIQFGSVALTSVDIQNT